MAVDTAQLTAPRQKTKLPPVVVCWLLPSVADLFFLVLLTLLVYTPLSASLLRDADIGWHIRIGEQILATHSIPRIDPFSYTRTGQPWYAWEWLYDLLIAAIHHAAGLNGVVCFTAFLLALTFALLFRFVLARSGNLSVAAALTLLSMAAAQVHMLARPHVLSWLLTLLWTEQLLQFEEGSRRALLWLPPLMLLWANLHAGFVLGLGLLALLAAGSLVRALVHPRQEDRERLTQVALVLSLCMLVTLLTPYGYRLHVHVAQYLSNHYLMNVIDEFASPNFHDPVYRYFELFLVLIVAATALALKRITAIGWLLLLFCAHAGLYAVRNIPIAAIVMSMVLGPPLAAAMPPIPGRPSCHGLLETGQAIADDLTRLEAQLRGHVWSWIYVAATVAILCNRGWLLSRQVLNSHFEEKVFPVQATAFIRRQNIRDHLFSSDAWSGYLIYRLYPETRVYFDDRHDFYGEAFIREYAEAALGKRRWREPLDHYQVKWVLMPADAPLSSLLRDSPDWRVAYQDDVAVVFFRWPTQHDEKTKPSRFVHFCRPDRSKAKFPTSLRRQGPRVRIAQRRTSHGNVFRPER